MASKGDPEFEVPDNSRTGSPDTSGFEASGKRLEQLVTGMEALLSDVQQLRNQCSHQAAGLVQVAAELRQQQEELKESYADLSREMQQIMETMEDLFTTTERRNSEGQEASEGPTEGQEASEGPTEGRTESAVDARVRS